MTIEKTEYCNVDLQKELAKYNLEGKWNDYVGVQKSVLEVLREEGYFEDNVIVNEGDVTVDDLVDAFKKFLDRKNLEKPITTKITNKEYSVKERKNSIKKILLERKKIEFKELFDVVNKSYIAVTFLSILEMSKENVINIKQDKNFDNIYLEMR